MSNSMKRFARTVSFASAVTMIACAPAMAPSGQVNDRSTRLTDDVFERDVAQIDSLGLVLKSRAATASRVGAELTATYVLLARVAYDHNDDGVLVNQLLDAARRTSVATRDRSPQVPLARTRRPDLWALIDSASAAPTSESRANTIAQLEASLLRAQYEVLGAPRCDAWEAEASRIAVDLRIPPPAPRVVPPEPVRRVVPAPVVKPKPVAPVRVLSGVPSMVHFALDKSFLAPATQHALDAMIRAISTYPDVRIVLEGNTDQRGSIPYNEALSKRRAESVRGYLVSHGVAAARISTRALGKSQLETDATGVRDFARNRRVLLRYYGEDGVEISTTKQIDDLQVEGRVP